MVRGGEGALEVEEDLPSTYMNFSTLLSMGACHLFRFRLHTTGWLWGRRSASHDVLTKQRRWWTGSGSQLTSALSGGRYFVMNVDMRTST